MPQYIINTYHHVCRPTGLLQSCICSPDSLSCAALFSVAEVEQACSSVHICTQLHQLCLKDAPSVLNCMTQLGDWLCMASLQTVIPKAP